MSSNNHDALAAWLEAHPEIERVEAFVTDINGVAKGKWLERDKALALGTKGILIPVSVFALDAWGCDVAGAGLAFGTGDPDGIAFPVPGRFATIPWLDRPAAAVFLELRDRDGSPCVADPRGALQRVLARYAEKGLSPVVATELEFYLYRPGPDGAPLPPDGNMLRNDTLSTSALTDHADLFDTIFAAAHDLGIPLDGMISEAGPGQFEINLLHRDALSVADDVVLTKRLVRQLARRFGLAATFMAKPYGEASGSGMHIHASLWDAQGRNVLAEPDGQPSAMLRHAVAGLLHAMPRTMLAFAPNFNSFRRFRPDAHAPVSAGWGIDDRSAAVRVIVADAKQTRIEHRISGADCNPHVALAAMLGAMLEGIEAGHEPPPAQDPQNPGAGERLPTEWGAAIDGFAASEVATRIFGERFRDIFVACKRQDRDAFLARIDGFEYDTYLNLV